MPACIVCPVLHPASDPAYADHGQVCAPDNGLMTSWLKEISELWVELVDPPAIERDTRTWKRTWMRGNRPIINLLTGRPILIEVPVDPVLAYAPAGPVRGASNTPRVSGGDERPLGVHVGRLDLLIAVANEPYLRRRQNQEQSADWWEPQVRAWREMVTVEMSVPDGCEGPVMQATVPVWRRELARDPNGDVLYVPCGDQIGHVPPAVWLDRAARAWSLAGAPGKELPEPHVPAQVKWLVDRLPWAVDHYLDLAAFAAELRRARGALRNAVGEGEDRPVPVLGVRCGNVRCGRMGTLVRDSGRIECTSCERTFSEDQLGELENDQRKTRKPKTMTARRAA